MEEIPRYVRGRPTLEASSRTSQQQAIGYHVDQQYHDLHQYVPIVRDMRRNHDFVLRNHGQGQAEKGPTCFPGQDPTETVRVGEELARGNQVHTLGDGRQTANGSHSCDCSAVSYFYLLMCSLLRTDC